MLSVYSSRRSWILVLMILLIVVMAGACTQSTTKTNSPSTPVSSGTLLVEAGRDVYSNWCARCHGQDGQGLLAPALIGSNAALGKYATARDLHDTLSKTMPQDKPGSLTGGQYLQVTGFILARNNYVIPDEFNLESLSKISFTR